MEGGLPGGWKFGRVLLPGWREEGFLRSSFDVSCTKAVIVALGVWFWEQDLLLYQSWNASLGLGRVGIPTGLTPLSSLKWEQGDLYLSHPTLPLLKQHFIQRTRMSMSEGRKGGKSLLCSLSHPQLGTHGCP